MGEPVDESRLERYEHFGVHSVTVSTELAAGDTVVVVGMKSLGVDRGEFQSIMRLIQSQLDVSIQRHIQSLQAIVFQILGVCDRHENLDRAAQNGAAGPPSSGQIARKGRLHVGG